MVGMVNGVSMVATVVSMGNVVSVVATVASTGNVSVIATVVSMGNVSVIATVVSTGNVSVVATVTNAPQRRRTCVDNDGPTTLRHPQWPESLFSCASTFPEWWTAKTGWPASSPQ